MAILTIRHIKRLALLAGFLPLLTAGGCVNDSSDCPQTGDGDKELFHLEFAISTRRTASGAGNIREGSTRAADIDGEVHGCPAENFINIADRDLQFLLFDGERKFLQPLDLNDVREVYTASDYSLYTFHTPVTAQYFKDNIGTTFSFYIMALANGAKMGMTYPVPTVGETIEDVVSSTQGNASNSLLTVKPVTSQLFSADIANLQLFPMAGLQKFTVYGPDLRKGTEAQPYNISANGKEINMLRAMAKIEVIDHVNFTGNYNDSYANDENRIAKVEINGIMNAGCILPAIGEWTNADADETQQVDNPTIPAGASYQNPHPIGTSNTLVPNDADMVSRVVIDFNIDEYAMSLRSDNCPVYSCYIYEYALANLADTQTPPYARITTKGRSVGGQTEGSRIMPMPISEYENGVAVRSVASLLRNHIYRYQINSINQDNNVDVQWTVCPLDEVPEIVIPPFN